MGKLLFGFGGSVVMRSGGRCWGIWRVLMFASRIVSAVLVLTLTIPLV